jgi:hypothetical protein
MLKRTWIVAALALLIAPLVARADFKQGDYEVTLSGQGANGPDFDGLQFGVNGALGYFLTDEFEVALRQSVGYSDVGGGGSALNGSTRVAVDYNFNLGQWVPYIGANLGYAYGDAVNDTWFAAPEGGIKYFVNNTTFIFLSVEYQFFFDQGDDVDDSFSDGQFLYGLGIGFKF